MKETVKTAKSPRPKKFRFLVATEDERANQGETRPQDPNQLRNFRAQVTYSFRASSDKEALAIFNEQFRPKTSTDESYGVGGTMLLKFVTWR